MSLYTDGAMRTQCGATRTLTRAAFNLRPTSVVSFIAKVRTGDVLSAGVCGVKPRRGSSA